MIFYAATLSSDSPGI